MTPTPLRECANRCGFSLAAGEPCYAQCEFCRSKMAAENARRWAEMAAAPTPPPTAPLGIEGTIRLRTAGIFTMDHFSRFEESVERVEVIRARRVITADWSAEDAANLLGDAEFYAEDIGRDFDEVLKRSASAVARAIRKQAPELAAAVDAR